MGVFEGAKSNGGVRFSWKSIFGVELIDLNFDYGEAIDFDRHFKTWSIFDETSSFEHGGFRGRWIEWQWRCSFVWKSIFVVESIDSTTAERSILIDFLKLGRFSTKLRNSFNWASRVLGPLRPQWLVLMSVDIKTSHCGSNGHNTRAARVF